MRLAFKQLEEYEGLGDKEITQILLRCQAELDEIPDKMDNDIELQKAIELVNARKSVYEAKKKQLKGVIKTLHLICRQRGLYANK